MSFFLSSCYPRFHAEHIIQKHLLGHRILQFRGASLRRIWIHFEDCEFDVVADAVLVGVDAGYGRIDKLWVGRRWQIRAVDIAKRELLRFDKSDRFRALFLLLHCRYSIYNQRNKG